ncbi:hypothetical protein R3X27_15215 [Tropicimonas sp. TH_r6]|uniref:hypothetical protein n=1 Tax=Tropicimonas sp. TH_r6 TaxID=3082085 RepID=UPI002955CCB0|nr:hypothetical protein [Tropicimonas sp. TH_r6]MDV7144037.1 hypothetical protein [Tropicimonas sp. TH_r6]
MSFSIAAQRFMSVSFQDDAGAAISDFTLQPTRRTVGLMNDHGILFRQVTGGMALYYTTNPFATPPLTSPIGDRVRFSFSLTAAAGDPGLRYDGMSGAGGSHLLLDNLDGAGTIQPAGPITTAAQVGSGEHIYAGPRAYPVQLDLTGGIPAVIEAQDRFTGTVAASTPVNDPLAEPPVAPPPGSSAIFATVDIPESRAGALQLVTPAPGTLNRLIYADDDVAADRAIGIVDLYWTGPQSTAPANTGTAYTAAFQRR